MNINDNAVQAAMRVLSMYIDERMSENDPNSPYTREGAVEILQAAAPHLTRPRIVTTAEELDALEVGAVVLGKWLAQKWATPEGDVWFIAGRNMEWFTDDLVMRAGLPATVLHKGGKA